MLSVQELPDLSLEPLCILLVEDDEHLRDSLRETLEEEGYLVQAVPSGADAIALSANRRFDLIVTDIKTPGASDGLAALETVKAGNPEVAGIVITGYSTEEYALRAAKLKVEDYLKKPFDIEDFLGAVDRLAEKKRQAQALLAREVLFQRAMRWMAGRLVERWTERSSEEVEGLFRSTAGQFRDPREQLALESAVGLRVLAEHGLLFPEDLGAVFPPRVAQALAAESGLGEQVAAWARGFVDGLELESATAEDSSESLHGSLLNVALLLESAERYDEARTAFEDVLKQSGDPAQRYLAHFGLARLALPMRQLEILREQVGLAVSEGTHLGPITHSQALAERGVLLALGREPSAEEALAQAWEFARTIKDTGSFALVSLAREHFLGQPAANRSRLLGYLMQPEQFELATEAAGWLIGLLLSQPELEAEERRFLTRLLRAAPASFERLVLQTDNSGTLCNAVPFLEVLNEERRGRVLSHLNTLDDHALRGRLAQWSAGKRRQQREKSLLRVFTFSGIRLYRDDEALEITRKKPLLLLLYLLYRNVPVGEEALLELFWPGDESKARATMRTTLSYLRKLVSPDGELDPLPRQANALCLSPDIPVWFDYREFESLVQRGKSTAESSPERTMECFRSAVRLYRGPFLESIYEDWALEAREQAELAYEHCLGYLASGSLAVKNWGQAYEYAARGLRRDPLSLTFCEMTMQAQIGLQRHRDALATYEQCRMALLQELGAEPSIEMMRCRELAKLGV